MRLKVKYVDIDLDVFIINTDDAKKLELISSSIIRLSVGEQNITGRVINTAQVVSTGTIGIPSNLPIIFKADDLVEVTAIHSPENKRIIDKFLKTELSLSEEEIKYISD